MLRNPFLLLLRIFAVIAASISLAHSADSVQGRRVALVIGNSDYQHPKVLSKLPNPINDAEDVATALRRFGFDVIERKNQTLDDMNQVIIDFGRRIDENGTALFYFAGHGLQADSQNYLMPIDAKMESEPAVKYQSVNINDVLYEMDRAKSATNIVILDACRNPPFGKNYRSAKTRGLAIPGTTPKGTVIVYATDPGNVALDGEGRNGLFTSGLLNALKGTALSLDDVLTVTSEYVEQKSLEIDPTQRQTPYVNGPKTLQRNFNFRVTVDPGTGEIEKTFWTSIERSDDPANFIAYLKQYPKGSYRTLAENHLKRLKAKSDDSSRQTTAVSPPVHDADSQFWNEVKSNGTREYLGAYLKQYPKGRFVALAKLELKKLDDHEKEAREKELLAQQAAAENARQEAIQTDRHGWDQAKAANTVRAYSIYLENHPKGQYASLADAAKMRLQREAEEKRLQQAKLDAAQKDENALWAKADGAQTESGVQEYLDRYPIGRYVAEARAKLSALKEKESLEKRLKTPGKLFLLSIGISKYPDPFTLGSANKDARDIPGRLASRSTTLYNSIVPKLLIDESATRKNILEGLDWLRDSVGENDTGVIILAGHGEVSGGSYTFIPSDIEAFPAKGTVKSYAEHQQWKDANASARWIPASAFIKSVVSSRGRMLVFIDTLHSGQFARQLVKEVESTSTQVKPNISVMVSGTRKVATVVDETLGNGAFTIALIEGLKGAAEKSPDGWIRFNELGKYVFSRVKNLTNDELKPLYWVFGTNDPIAK